MLQHADQQPADQVDHRDHDAGDRVAAHILARTVHRAVELGFLRHLGAALARLGLADQSGVEVGVDRHLLARHRVEREARADFGDAPGALGHDDEVDHGQDHEHHHADQVVAADQEMAEGLDHLARRIRPGVAVGQHHPGRGHVERQPQHGGHQQHGREGHELQRAHRVERRQQHDDRQRDVEAEEDVEDERRHRQDHQRQDHHDQARRGQRLAVHAAQQQFPVHVRSPVSGAVVSSGSKPGGSATGSGRTGAKPPWLR